MATVSGAAAVPQSTLLALEAIIAAREAEAGAPGAKPSWTAKLLGNPELLASKVREEAGELCDAALQQEGRQRVASEAADLLYHALVLLRTQVCCAVVWWLCRRDRRGCRWRRCWRHCAGGLARVALMRRHRGASSDK